jgi:hypothetical protein
MPVSALEERMGQGEQGIAPLQCRLSRIEERIGHVVTAALEALRAQLDAMFESLEEG